MNFKESPLRPYRSVRIVKACRIEALVNGPQGWMLHPSDTSIDPFRVPMPFIVKFNPAPGGYYVVQESGLDGYEHSNQFERDHIAADDLEYRRDALQRQLDTINEAINRAKSAQPKE